MATFPEFIGGTLGALKAAKAGPFKVGTGGLRYVAVFNTNAGTGTVVTTDTTTETQVFFGSLGGEGIIWQGSSPGTSSDPFYPDDGYVTSTAYVSLDGGTDTQTFPYTAPDMVGTVFSTAFLLATETILTTFVNTNTTNYSIQEVTMFKSTNTGQTWTAQDTAHDPVLSFFYNQYSVCFDQNNGTAIHMAFTDSDDKLSYIRYDCNSDSWGSPVQGPAPLSPAIGNTKFVTMSLGCIHQPVGNHMMVIAQATNNGANRYLNSIQYSIGGASWGSFQALGTGTITTGSWVPSAIICGSGDLVTTLAESMPAGTNPNIMLWQQAISSGGSPGTQQEITAGESPGGEIAEPYPADLCWNSVDNVVTGVFFLQGFDSQTIYCVAGSSADPISLTTHSFAGATAGSFVEDIACGVNGAGTYIFWPVPLGDFSAVVFNYVTNLGPINAIGTTTDYPGPFFSLDAAGFSSSEAITWNEGASSSQFYWEIFPPSFTGHRVMPQYIKRSMAPGN